MNHVHRIKMFSSTNLVSSVSYLLDAERPVHTIMGEFKNAISIDSPQYLWIRSDAPLTMKIYNPLTDETKTLEGLMNFYSCPQDDYIVTIIPSKPCIVHIQASCYSISNLG